MKFGQQLTCSIRDAGEILGLGRTTIYGLMQTGALETFSIGRRRLVTIASINSLVESKTNDNDNHA
jgi:predicted DNA-binding transcriptional regulator AlpA